MKHQIKESRVLIKDRVRSLCIRQNYCTECDNHQYEAMLALCDRDDLTLYDTVTAIAEKIIEYSDTDQFIKVYGVDEPRLYEAICFSLINDCTISFISLKEGDEL